MGPADWGDVPTWIGGAGALAAGWFAFQTIQSQRQQIGEQQAFIAEQTQFMDEQRQNLELERAELRAAAEYRKWSQARQVRMEAVKVPQVENGIPSAKWTVTVTNLSAIPVTNLEVRFGSAYVAAEVCEWVPEYLGEARGRRGGRLLHPAPILGPERAARFFSQEWPAATAHNNRPVLLFTDAGGVRWRLDSYGKLEEVPADGMS